MTKHITRLWCASAALAVGCTKPNNTTCADDYCQDETLPFCDVDGSLAGEPNTCIAVECTPGEFEACRGETELRCNAAGTNYDIGQCELGCDDATGCIIEVIDNDCTPGEVRCGNGTLETCNVDGAFESEACAAGCVPGAEPHCAVASPRFLPDICDAPASNQSSFSVASFSTDDDAFCNGGIVAQNGGPEICVVRFGEIVIPNSGADIVVSGARAVAFVADTQIRVEGTLDISANGQANGPAGGILRSGGSTGGGVGDPAGKGGGGAGFASPGGHGGTITDDAGAGNGGADVGALPEAVLIGGTRPESGFAPSSPPSPGGAGGAATLIACRGSVNVTGTIDAGGGGGAGGRPAVGTTRFHGGAGGGSGGHVVLQGLAVSVTGRMFANGGAGGNGLPSTQSPGPSGSDGGRSTLPASRGTRILDEGLGGFGQSVRSDTTTPMFGSKPLTNGRSPGGGGGSMGRLVAITPAGLLPSISTPNQSPQVLSFDTLQLQ